MIARTSDVNYILKLPDDWNIHNVFHVSKLRRYIESDDELFPDRKLKPLPDIIQGEEEWEVEAILNDKIVGKTRKYLIKWKGFGDDSNTWQTATDLKHAKDKIQEYKDQKALTSKKPRQAQKKSGSASLTKKVK